MFDVECSPFSRFRSESEREKGWKENERRNERNEWRKFFPSFSPSLFRNPFSVFHHPKCRNQSTLNLYRKKLLDVSPFSALPCHSSLLYVHAHIPLYCCYGVLPFNVPSIFVSSSLSVLGRWTLNVNILFHCLFLNILCLKS